MKRGVVPERSSAMLWAAYFEICKVSISTNLNPGDISGILLKISTSVKSRVSKIIWASMD
jgi:hypothetical protein